MSWKQISDKDVRHIWVSECDEECESHGEEIAISPDFYEENGEPNCGSCGKVFNYERTEVNIDD